MIQLRSMLDVADNSGARKIRVIRIWGGYNRRYGRVGDVVTASVREASPHTPIKKGDVVHAVILRTRKETGRPDGMYVRFDDNACAIIDKESMEPKGTRIFGPVARELRLRGFTKIISLAEEVV